MKSRFEFYKTTVMGIFSSDINCGFMQVYMSMRFILRFSEVTINKKFLTCKCFQVLLILFLKESKGTIATILTFGRKFLSLLQLFFGISRRSIKNSPYF